MSETCQRQLGDGPQTSQNGSMTLDVQKSVHRILNSNWRKPNRTRHSLRVRQLLSAIVFMAYRVNSYFTLRRIRPYYPDTTRSKFWAIKPFLARFAHRVLWASAACEIGALRKGVGWPVADLGRRNFFARVLALFCADVYGPSAPAVIKRRNGSWKGHMSSADGGPGAGRSP
jgi:hypothetical protein